jgi:hypothetical protein
MVATESIPIDCEHANAGGRCHFVSCSLGLYGGMPHVSICQACPSRSLNNKAVNAQEVQCDVVKQDKEVIPPPSRETIALAIKRADICRGCPYNQGIQLQDSGPDAFTVKCRRAANGIVSLISGTCRARRWTSFSARHTHPNRLAGIAGSNVPQPVVLRDYFGAIHVISLKRTPARLQRFWEQLPKDWPFQRPQVFEAIDADHDRAWGGWRGGGGAYGCWRSWMTILAGYLAELPKSPPARRKPILIMEDDCEFTPDSQTRFREFISGLPADWEVAFPGGQHFQGTVPFSSGIVRCRETGRTHCVMINAGFVAELYSYWLKWDTHIDHGLQHWCKNNGERKFFAADPFFAIQGANWSTIRWRQEPARSWDGRVQARQRKPADVPIVLLDEPAHTVRKLRDEGKIHTGYWRNERDVDRGLIDLMSKPLKERNTEIKKWIQLVRNEAAAFSEAALGIWWPSDTLAMERLLAESQIMFEISTQETNAWKVGKSEEVP